MAVYVDWMGPTIPSESWRYKKGCHLLADSEDELHRFAKMLGLKQSWFQPRPQFPHYDLTFRKRRAALLNGAIEVDLDWYKKRREKRIKAAKPPEDHRTRLQS